MAGGMHAVRFVPDRSDTNALLTGEGILDNYLVTIQATSLHNTHD